MPYGILKADTLTYYTASGDISIPVSGIAATVSGTISVPSGTQAAPSISYVGDPDTGFYSPGANQVAIATSGTGRVFVDASGNVGIGTSSPDAALHVNGTIYSKTATNPTIGIWNTTTAYSTFLIQESAEFKVYTGAGQPITFANNGTERVRITSDGKVGIGIGLPVNGLHVYGAGQATANITDAGNKAAFIRVSDSGSSAGSGGGILFSNVQGDNAGSAGFAAIKGLLNNGSSNTTGDLAFSLRTSATDTALTERMRISNSGVVTIKNGAVAEIGTLTDGATITPDFAANCNFTVTISGNRTMANPTNITAGQAGSVFIVQGSGSNTLGWGSYWDFPSGTAPTLSTASGAVDRVDYIVRTATSIHTVFTANYS